MHKKHAEIKNRLSEGFTVREVSALFQVSTKTVQSVRAQYPDLFPGRWPVAVSVIKKIKIVRSRIRGSVPFELFNKFIAEAGRAGVSLSELLTVILSERYCSGDRMNGYILPADCGCDDRDVIKNLNSNLNRDGMICCRCGRVFDGGV